MEIVGLKHFVQDDVNKLIAKFVGFQSKPVKELKNFSVQFVEGLLFSKHVKVIRCFLKELQTLNQIKSIPKRREAFLNLRAWKRRYLIHFYARDLFPMNYKNLRFLFEQMRELGFKTLAYDWYDFKLSSPRWFDVD